MSLSDYDHHEDVVARIEEEFPSRHRNARRLKALVRGFGDAVQELEDLIYTYIADTTLQLSTGQQLDFWGELVGEERGPFSDTIYRELIKARATINVSGNNIPDLLDVWQTSTSAEKIWYYEHPPAGIRLEALRGEWMSDARAGRVVHHIELASNAGVDYKLVEKLPRQLELTTENGFQSDMSRTLN